MLTTIYSQERGGLRFDVFAGSEPALSPNCVLISGERDAILIDVQFVRDEARELAERVRDTGRNLKAAYITHAHPDHYGGMAEIQAAFPDTPIFARQGVIDGILEWPAKRLHWQEAYGDQIPDEMPVPRPLTGERGSLEGHEVVFVDLPVAETVHATAFHVPGSQALIAGDLLNHHSHCYMADTNNPGSWLTALDLVQALGELTIVVPGHGPVGGTEVIDDTRTWLQDYQEVAGPRVPVADIAREMGRRHPDRALPMLLWLTRGPSFGLVGPKELGVPPEVFGG
ncbi:MBL fold metallo-hydrolase [Streptomyces flaveus]|uniref:MBL fold metallo-hydrolase n=1 Tax=Streptomyces flaveus TaxID=66370 RepID=UPI003332A472